MSSSSHSPSFYNADYFQNLPPPDISTSAFFVCDIQETFRDKIINWSELLFVSSFLCKVGSILNIPMIVTEQKPFKPTVSELCVTTLPNTKIFSKTKFSMMTDEVNQYIKELENNNNNNNNNNGEKKRIDNIYLFGIESHVCVLQTILDLQRQGRRIFIISDAVSSQRLSDRSAAFHRYDKLFSVVITTAESAIFELLGDAQHTKFKSIVPLVKELSQSKAQLSKL